MSYVNTLGSIKALSRHNYLSLSTKLENDEIGGFIMIDKLYYDTTSYTCLLYSREYNSWIPACGDSVNSVPARGILLNDTNSGDFGAILIYGNIRNPNWNFGGDIVYLSPWYDGEITTDITYSPHTIMQQIGYLENSDQIFFNFPPVWLYNIE